jgi:HlyD family secretion protein
MKKKTKWILLLLLFVAILLVVLAKTGVFGKKEGTKVTAENVQRRTIIEVVNASGKVYPVTEVKISPDISGEITELLVKEGDTVKKGQLLAKIFEDIYSIQKDQASYGVAQSQSQLDNVEASLQALKAQYEQAETNFRMQQKLFDEKVISKSEFIAAEAAFKTAKANYEAGTKSINATGAAVQSAKATLNRASKDLSRTIIIAPMDGVVSLLNVKKGEKVAGNSFNVGTEILRIADMGQMEVRVDVGENDIPKVKLGDSALVTIDAYSDRKFKGIVTQIASSNNGASAQLGVSTTTTDVTQYKVYIRLLPESYTDLLGKGSFPFKPGMSANADIQTQTRTNVLSVPVNAVTTREKENVVKKEATQKDEEPTEKTIAIDDLDVVVFVIDKDGKVRKKLVKTGIQDINHFEITNGLKEGDQVITGPYDVVSKTLKDSMDIKVVDPKDLFEKKD